MAVERRTFLHEGVHIGNRHENSDLSASKRFGNGELVQVTGLVVVNGCPQQIAQVAHLAGHFGRPVDGGEFLLCRWREVRLQAAINHGPVSNGSQCAPIRRWALRNRLGLVVVHAGGAGAIGCHKIGISRITRIALVECIG